MTQEQQAAWDRMSEQFMAPQVTRRMEWIAVDGPMGSEWIPGDVTAWRPRPEAEWPADVPPEIADYCENATAWDVAVCWGFGARLSAAGYLDCTEWAVFPTEAEAIAHLIDAYGDDDDEWDDDESDDDDDDGE